MKLLTIVEVAEALGVSRATVGRMISDSSLPAICLRSGKRKRVLRVREEVLTKWLMALERETAKEYAGSRGVASTGNGNHDSSQQ
jgi:excisionase family DNA binding protein